MDTRYQKNLNPVVNVTDDLGTVNIKNLEPLGTLQIKNWEGLGKIKIICGPRGPKGEPGEAGRGISKIRWTEGDHSPGTLDTYTIYYTDGSWYEFQVYNGDDAQAHVEYNTTAAWDAQPMYQSELGAIYIYTDKYTDEDGDTIPGFKIGTGGLLINIPFTDALLQEHLNDNIRHITQEEREFWNNKERAFVLDNNTLVLTKF